MTDLSTLILLDISEFDDYCQIKNAIIESHNYKIGQVPTIFPVRWAVEFVSEQSKISYDQQRTIPEWEDLESYFIIQEKIFCVIKEGDYDDFIICKVFKMNQDLSKVLTRYFLKSAFQMLEIHFPNIGNYFRQTYFQLIEIVENDSQVKTLCHAIESINSLDNVEKELSIARSEIVKKSLTAVNDQTGK